MLEDFFLNSGQKIDVKLLETAFFLSRVLRDLNYVENDNLTWFKQKEWSICQQILYFVIVKWSFVSSLWVENPTFFKIKLCKQSCANDLGKIGQVKKKQANR